MSINVYLKDEEVRKVKGFEVIKHKEKDGSSWKEYRLPGIYLSYEKGRWHIILHYPIEPIPSLVSDIVEGISFRDWIPLIPKREAGIYHYKSAEAEVEMSKIGGTKKYHVHIKAKEMKDVLELFRRIRAGSIRPDESYEGEQSGMSRKELEAQLKEAKESTEELGREYDRFRSLLEKADDRIRKLSSFEDEGLWSFLRRKFWKSSES